MSDDSNSASHVDLKPRTITLNKFENTDYYQLWWRQVESTFDVWNVTDIVLGKEKRPESDDVKIKDWDRRHKLAKEALFSALKPQQMLRVSHLKSAHEIQQRLDKEYGKISELKYAQIDAKLHSLRKADNISMKDHIDEFENLQYQLEFHSGKAIEKKDVNVAFRSLGDSETWKNYRNANIHRAPTIETVDLIAEVTIIDDSSRPASSFPSLSDAKALRTSAYPASYRGGHQRGGYRGSYQKRSGDREKVRDVEDGCEGCGDPDHEIEECPLQCGFCHEPGHLINHCLKRQWVNLQRSTKRQSKGNGKGNSGESKEAVKPKPIYSPSFEFPRR